jgi:hypothetical protein
MPKAPPPLSLTAFEEYMFRDDRPAYPMSIVVRLCVSGNLDRNAATTAFGQAVARHRLLWAVIRQTSTGLEWAAADHSPMLHWLGHGAHDRLPAMTPIDLMREPGLRAWAAADSQRSTIVLQVHHAACDGKGVMQLVGDFLCYYARAVAPDQSAIDLPPCDDELLRGRGKFGLTAWKFLKMLPAQLSGLKGVGKFLLRQPVPLLAGAESKPCGSFRLTPGPRRVFPCAEHDGYEHPDAFPNVRVGRLDAGELQRLSAAAADCRVSVNDWLLRDFFLAVEAFRRRHAAPGKKDCIRISVPMNLRQPADARMPAANVVSMVFLDRNAAQLADPLGLLRGIREQLALIRRRQLGLTFHWSLMALRVLPGGLAARVSNGRCEATCVVSNLGRVLADSPLPRCEEKIVSGNVRLEDIEVFAPIREGTAASVALVFYAGGLRICLQYDGRRITSAQAEDLLDTYLHTIRSSLGGEARAAKAA